jgi:hypothetical protein
VIVMKGTIVSVSRLRPDVELEHAVEGEAEHQAGVRAHHDGDADQHAHGVEVGREPRHEVADAVVVVVRGVEPGEVVEQVVADVELDLPRGVQQRPADDDHGAAAGEPMPGARRRSPTRSSSSCGP